MRSGPDALTVGRDRELSQVSSDVEAGGACAMVQGPLIPSATQERVVGLTQ